jgi:cytochrome c peroxidase
MTTRNSSVLFNLAFTKEFFWDGRTKTLEATCKDALKGEQKFNIDFIKTRLIPEQRYKDAFNAAFNTTEPTDDMVEKSLASFIRTMVSGSSRVDKGKIEGNPNKYLSTAEIEGRNIFETEEGDCFHCHGDITGQPLMTDNLFHNNGLDSFMSAGLFKDPGLGFVTGVSGADAGKFKTGALRNLSYSKPFMHDGRLANLDAVLAHYNSGVKNNFSIDPNMKKANQGGLQLTPDRIARLKAYLLAFDDPGFISDTSFSNPFK